VVVGYNGYVFGRPILLYIYLHNVMLYYNTFKNYYTYYPD